MNADQLASRLANLYNELKHAKNPEWIEEVQDAFRRTDVAFRAARQAELDAMDPLQGVDEMELTSVAA